MRISMLCLCVLLGLNGTSVLAAERTALESGRFESEMRRLENERLGPERLRRAKDLVQRHWYSSQQVKAIALKLPDDDARLDFATAAYPRTIDPEHFYEVYDAFTSFSKVFRLHDRVRAFPAPGAPSPGGPVATLPEPMSPGDFRPILQALKDESFDQKRLQLARQILTSSRGNFLSAQVRDMAKCFDFETAKLEFAKLAYDYTLDREKYFLVNEAFSFANTRETLSRYLVDRGRPMKPEREE